MSYKKVLCLNYLIKSSHIVVFMYQISNFIMDLISF